MGKAGRTFPLPSPLLIYPILNFPTLPFTLLLLPSQARLLPGPAEEAGGRGQEGAGEARGSQEDRQPDMSLVSGTPGLVQRPRLPDQGSCLHGGDKTSRYLHDAPES